ncbi:hypothetical protein [Methanobacterium sp.]|uniref:hypothetical protein n=1 Tax=Methanobacterium sp. TaxID=2164 RepID=UPI003D65446B
MENSLKIVTTPMCEEIVKLAGISDYKVSKDPDSAHADVAVVLSETQTATKSLKIKLNTFKQIKESIILLSNSFGTKPLNYEIKNTKDSNKDKNRKIKVRVYSNFLKDIVEDMGYNIVQENPHFVVYPDYMKDEIKIEDYSKAVEIPSHKNAPLNPIKRAEMKYNILEKELCMKP